MKKPSKPKFRVGQIVAVKKQPSWFPIREVEYRPEQGAGYGAGFWYRDLWSWYRENGLRPLTKREAGR